MRVVLKIWSGNPNWDGGCDYAMVDLTPEVAALALGRIGTVREQQATDPELNKAISGTLTPRISASGWRAGPCLVSGARRDSPRPSKTLGPTKGK